MMHTATKAVERYRKAAQRVRFDEADKQEIYKLLSRAEGLIARLDDELSKLAASTQSDVKASTWENCVYPTVRSGEK